jgi:hypothetical protein
MNNCNFTGRLTKDPELKTTQSGKKYLRFCLAVDGIKDKDGNKTADFVDCIAWNKSGEIIAQYKTQILPTDSPEDIADKVHILEMKYYPLVIEQTIKRN